MMRSLLMVFLLWLIPASPALQAQGLEEMKFELLDEAQGLSNQWISDIALDSSGFIWIGTLGGLNRFDGQQFKVFRHDATDKTSILHDYGQKIYISSIGEVWISYREGGFSKYDPATQGFVHYRFSEKEIVHRPDRDFGIKFIDRSGNIWYSGDGMGLNRYHPGTGQKSHFDLPEIHEKYSETDNNEFNTVYSIYRDERDMLWLCTQNGLYEFNPKTDWFSYKKYNATNPFFKRRDMFSKIVPEGNQGLWVASWDGGINYFDRKTEQFTNYLFEKQKYGFYNLAYDMAPKSADELWIVSGDRGLGVFNKKTGNTLFQRKLVDRERSEIVFLNSMLKLPSGIIFLADENALLRYNPDAHQFHFTRLKLEHSQHGDLFHIRKILENPQRKEQYFVTELGGGLVIKNTVSGALRTIPVDVKPGRDPQMRLLNMVKSKKGRYWLVSRDYFYEFVPASGGLRKMRDPFPTEKNEAVEYLNVAMDPDGELVVLANNGKLYPFDEKTERFLTAPEIKHPSGNAVHVQFTCFDNKGNLWIWAPGVLGCRLKGHDKFTFETDKKVLGILKEKVRNLAAGTHGEVWLAAYDAGLVSISVDENGQFTSRIYGKKDGLPALKFTYIDVDTEGNPWVSGFMGVLRYDRKSGVFKLYNSSTGLEKYTISMRFFSSDGAFYIVSPGNYCKVDLKVLNATHQVPVPYIDKVHVYNTHRDIPVHTGMIGLKPGEDYFSMDFGSITYGGQTYNRYSYKLEGWDKDWIDAGNRHNAIYTNLKGGEYRFWLRVAGTDGKWSEPVSVRVNIDTYFYRKTWFSVLMLLVFSGIVFSLYMYRIRRVRATERLRAEFQKQITESRMEALRAQMNPHFIFNSLNSINRYIIKNDPKTSSLYLTRFARLMRLVLDNSRYKTIPLSTELEALKLYIELEAFRFEKKFEFEINVHPDVDVDALQIPPLIVQPYVENAIWHGLLHRELPGKLLVDIHRTEDLLCIEITDNGVGRAKAAELEEKKHSTRKSLGMKLTEERLDFQNEQVYVSNVEIVDLSDQNGAAAGTRVIVKIHIAS